MSQMPPLRTRLGEVPEIASESPVLVFGGPYSNLQATEAVLAEAARRRIPANRVICTGDLAAYCAQPMETIDLVRRSGMHVVMGNCDAQLAEGADDCGCGFPGGTACDRLSASWYAFARKKIRPDQQAWLATFPDRIDLLVSGLRLAVVHGSVSQMNAFVFAGSEVTEKREELALSGADGVIGGHCGLPFSALVDGKPWLNAGVVGMPANDGTQRVWFMVITPRGEGAIDIAHVPLSYDVETAANAMRQAGLPAEYRLGMTRGLWPSLDILPETERMATGTALVPVTWTFQSAHAAACETTADRVVWPACRETARLERNVVAA